MRLLFIRHGDPNYELDALTPEGKIEAECLAKHIDYWNIDDIYLSPLGRAQETASYSIRALEEQRGTKIDTVTLPWIREFNALVDVPANNEYLNMYPNALNPDKTLRKHIVWDIVPGFLNDHPEYYDSKAWKESQLAKETDLLEQYSWVVNGIDEVLASYGYVRDGMNYRVEKECTKTIAFFCHFGVTSVILSHLMNTSPFTLLQGTIIAPTSVTEVITEERQQGIASFRTWKMGDVSHLIMEGVEPAFSGRFCEVYSNDSQRH